MWRIVCLFTWTLLCCTAAGHDDGVPFPQSDSWDQCLAILTTEKFSPRSTDLWSRQPVCKFWRPKLAHPENAPLQTPCLFSYASFRDGHGVSLVATYEEMSDLLRKGVLDEEDQHSLHSSSPPWDIVPGPVSDLDTGIPAYEVRSLPGRGKGVIALRRIRQNETILLDHPSILVTWGMTGLSWTNTQESMLESAVRQLPEDARKNVLGLSRADTVPDLPLSDLFKTNICGLSLGPRLFYVGLFSEFARINHACIPNAFYRVSPRHLMMEVVAFRDIEPGEEIYINYAPHAMPYKERQEYLKSDYGFTCTCSMCAASESERSISDQYRSDMAVLRDEASKARRQRRWDDTLRYASETLEKLSEAETWAPGVIDYSLTPLFIDCYWDLADIYLEKRDFDMARSYAEKALDAIVHLNGADSSDAKELREILAILGKDRFVKV